MAKPKPILCPCCSDPLVTMYRIVHNHNCASPKYVPVHICVTCMIGVRLMTLPKDKDVIVARKPEAA